MDRVIVRKQIETLYRAGHKSDEIEKILNEQYSSKSPCLRTIQKWIQRVKFGDLELKDSPRSGRPAYVICEYNIDCVRKAISSNPKFLLRNLAGQLEISKDTVRKILVHHLDLKKMNARWVPFKLNESQKRVRVESSREIISTWEENWSELIDRIVTTDETWVCYENTDTRFSAAEWRKKSSKPPEIPKLRANKRKIMATVFWDSKGILMVDILPPNQTLTHSTIVIFWTVYVREFGRKEEENFRKESSCCMTMRDHIART
ncbi:histone-lysine N-methyltransferase SETMAR-like [Brevipalpus obovatus]|uniref:histone-lysine N-methyltransferase SETMAR-like n=1 Tax=Brevipalpus obovatus TaxID=246614 RepID=UPI003D9EE514